jgi:hypothetical protein
MAANNQAFTAATDGTTAIQTAGFSFPAPRRALSGGATIRPSAIGGTAGL